MSKKIMLINAIDPEVSRMAILENGKLLEYNIQMSAKEPITGNIYKAVTLKVERGLQAAFVDYGGKRPGFLPLHDVSPEYYADREGGGERHGGRPTLKPGQEILIQVVREQKNQKGAMLTTYISLPGRYLVLMPNRQSTGVSRKIESDADRKRLMAFMEPVAREEKYGFIIRTAGMHRNKQELSRDYDLLTRLWEGIREKAASAAAPALIYQESDIAVRALRDYFTSDIREIWVDDIDKHRKMRGYFKTVSPRNVKMIKLYNEKTPLFDRYQIEGQIDAIYRERVELKSGGYIIVSPTEAMTTIDVNSGRGSDRRDVEETAFRTNIEAAEEIARQLRLRDLGGLIVIDFIDMKDRKHITDVEKNFKKALSLDRSRIQLSRISKFGILELSRQKKKSTIQEISHTICPYCKGSGLRPVLEYVALSTYRKIKAKLADGKYASADIVLPYQVSDYLLNRKRTELSKLESIYDASIHISGSPDMQWDEAKFEFVEKEMLPETPAETPSGVAKQPEAAAEAAPEAAKTEAPSRRRPRHRRRRPGDRDRKPRQEEGAPSPPQAETSGDAAPAPQEDPHRQETGEDKEAGQSGFMDRIYDLFKS
jgi:ribonuclease E